ncbi:MAG: class I tRNA ligase family protein, partial [Nitrospiria bacterium]
MDQKARIKESLNLPSTAFPMRANLAQRELDHLSNWDTVGLYDKIQDRHAGDPVYILHDGPPYANGHIHIGHALNKILKDIIVKSAAMRGCRAPYVPGWDCHGLPIEHQVLKKLGSKKRDMSKIEIRQKCRESALRFVEIQKAEFKRLGVFGEWDDPYLTLTPAYEAEIVRQFGKVFATGGVYKGKKPVLWCASDETALAEAEVEYADKTSPSIYVKFRVTDAKGMFPSDPGEEPFFVIWTTTPWTLVANKGVALHPKLNYRHVSTPSGSLIVAEDLVAQTMKAFGFE